MGQGTSLLALAVVKKALHECKLQGCSVELPFDEIKEHEEKCNWRLVRCPGSGSNCRAMVPFCTMIDHVGACTGFVNRCPRDLLQCENAFYRRTFYRTIVMREAFDGGGDRSWPASVHQLEEKLFFSRFVYIRGKYICDVVMGGTKEDCKDFIVEASVMDLDKGKSVFKAIFPPRPLDNHQEAKFCLSVKQKAISDVWRFNKQDTSYHLTYKVQIRKVQNLE